MSEYAYEVIRWPFDVQSPNNSFTFQEDGVGPPDSVQTVTAGTYINDGSASVIAPKDFVEAFKDEVNAAITALSLGGSCTVALNDAGKIVLTWTGQTGGDLLLTGLTATQQMWLGTASTSQSITAVTTTFAFQAGCQWHPQIDSDYDSGDLQRQIVSEGRNLKGEPRRVVRSYAAWVERFLNWSRVPGGVMSDARGADADYATVAGVSTGEDNTWENLWLYLTGTPGPYSDNRVYLYSTNDPATDTRTGPYDVILSECEPGLDGLPADGYVKSMSSEYYPVKILLREVSP